MSVAGTTTASRKATLSHTRAALPNRRRTVRRGWTRFLVGLVLLLVYLFPIYWMIATSFKSETQAFSYPPQLFPWPLNFDAWRAVITNSTIVHALFNSLVIGTGTAAVTLVLAVPAAYAMTHLQVGGRGVVLLVSLVSLMFPAVMLVMPLYQVFARAHLLNSYPGLILANATITTPFALLLIRPLIASIPFELVEAAQLDGASAWGAFWRVILPLSVPALATAAVFAFLMSWGDLVFAISLTTSNTMWPITAGLWNAVGNNVTDWPLLTAMATVALLPTTVVYLFAQRFVRSGLASSGLKE